MKTIFAILLLTILPAFAAAPSKLTPKQCLVVKPPLAAQLYDGVVKVSPRTARLKKMLGTRAPFNSPVSKDRRVKPPMAEFVLKFEAFK